jgi:predicted peroxiredoxin
MTNNVVIALSCGTDNPNRTTRALQMAVMSHKLGKNTTVFLLDEGVYIAKKGMADHLRSATGDSADDHLTYLKEFEVPILVCTPCAGSRQITKEDLIENASLSTADIFINLCCESAVISF